MELRERKLPQHHGYGEVAVSRYFALYLAMTGWLVLGYYLFNHAFWPSSCQPGNFLEIYQCSIRLPENRTWVESALMTWLWGTPILIALEFMRHYKKRAR